MDLKAILADLQKTAAETQPEVKPAATPEVEESQIKLAQDLYAGGAIFAEGFVDRLLEKLAGSGVPAGGGGIEQGSAWQQVAGKITAMNGKPTKPGDNTSIRAEQAGALSGAKHPVNPAHPLS